MADLHAARTMESWGKTSNEDREAPRGAWTEIERDRDAAARRAAVRRAHALGPGANIEATIRMIRAGEAMHGVGRR